MLLFEDDKGSRWTPRLLLSLIERFPEGSEFDAERMGGREFRDWNLEHYLMAGVINAVNSNTIATGSWKKGKTPDFPQITGPTDASGKPLKPKSSEPAPVKTPGGDSPKLLAVMARFAPKR